MIENVKSLLSEKKKVVIVPHMSPDGDAMGSSCALSLFLRNEGHEVDIITPDSYPAYLAWMPDIEHTSVFIDDRKAAKKKIADAEVFFFLDHNSESRQGDMQKHIEARDVPKIMIDHHPYPKANVDYMFSRVDVTSTCEMVYEFIVAFGGEDAIKKNIATCIYVGINTDTGGLSYNSSFPQTYRIVANLLEKGIDKPMIHELLYNTSTEGKLRLMGYCLSTKMKLIPECRAAIISLSKEEQEKYNYQEGDTEGFVNIPHKISDVDISIFVSEKKEKVKISFRSKRDVPINKLAEAYFNGGGHRNAAGGALELPLEEVLEKLERVLPIFVKEYNVI